MERAIDSKKALAQLFSGAADDPVHPVLFLLKKTSELISTIC